MQLLEDDDHDGPSRYGGVGSLPNMTGWASWRSKAQKERLSLDVSCASGTFRPGGTSHGASSSSSSEWSVVSAGSVRACSSNGHEDMLDPSIEGGHPHGHVTKPHGGYLEDASGACRLPSNQVLKVLRLVQAAVSVAGCAVAALHAPLPLVLTRHKGTRLAARTAVVWVAATAWRRARSCLRHRRPVEQQSAGHSAQLDAAAIGFPGARWLNPDACMRLMAQTNGDLAKARVRAASAHAWRTEMGLDHVHFRHQHTPHQQHHREANRSWWGLARSSHSHPPHHPTIPIHSKAATAAAKRFAQVSRILNISLVHINDQEGTACLWIKVATLSGVRKGLCQLLEAEASDAHLPAPDPGAWLQAIGVHIALLSDWLWAVRLPAQPLESGRFIQIVDLQGVNPASALAGEGGQVLRSIMSASHHYCQRLKATLVIHPPPGLALAWAIVSKMLPQPIVSKIRILRSKSTALAADLESVLPNALVPASAGGACVDLSKTPAQQEVECAMQTCDFH